jgi:hypothetical protein
MNITNLYTLTLSLKDAEAELAKINRELETSVDEGLSTGEIITVWQTDLNDHSLQTLARDLNHLILTNNFLFDVSLFNPEDTWFEVEPNYDVGVLPSNKLLVKSYKLYSPQENQSIRKVLLDKRDSLVTMCADLEKQIKEMVNV